MPFGSRLNNFAAVCSGGFIVASVIVSIVGAVISNRRVIETTHSNQRIIIEQNKELIEEHKEMLLILRGLERRYLVGQTK